MVLLIFTCVFKHFKTTPSEFCVLSSSRHQYVSEIIRSIRTKQNILIYKIKVLLLAKNSTLTLSEKKVIYYVAAGLSLLKLLKFIESK